MSLAISKPSRLKHAAESSSRRAEPARLAFGANSLITAGLKRANFLEDFQLFATGEESGCHAGWGKAVSKHFQRLVLNLQLELIAGVRTIKWD